MKLKAIIILLAACVLVLAVGIQAGMAQTPPTGKGCTPTPTPTRTCTPRPTPTVTVTCTVTPEPAPTVTVTCTPEPAPTVTVTATPEPQPTVTVTCTPTPAPTPTCTADFHWWMESCPLASCHLSNTGSGVVPLVTKYPHRVWVKYSSNITKLWLHVGAFHHKRWVRVKSGASLILRQPCTGYQFNYLKGRSDIGFFLKKPAK